ncbi:MAG: SBBP repeat-containing protein [Bacteroidetes bacterium]|nr:SBBP repeat-containing protein [Bacteroidota bacterium]
MTTLTMKTFTGILTAAALLTLNFQLITNNSFAQSGLTCNTAIPLTPADTCSYQTYITNGQYFWIKFKALSQWVNISVITVKWGINAPHIHNVTLLGGTCSNPVYIADDELPFIDYADNLQIDLNASGLMVDSTYYIRIARPPTTTPDCDKPTCRAASYTNPSAFNICIENVYVIIPLDRFLEPPLTGNAYQVNRGQLIDVNGNPTPYIKMYTTHSNPAVYIADTFTAFVFAKMDTVAASLDTLHRIDMKLEGAKSNLRTFKTENAPGITNHFLAHIPKGITGNKSYYRAVNNDVYEKIDMQTYSNSNGIKFYFIVHPGGNADDIIMKFSGANAVNVTADGGLEILSSIGKIKFDPGHAYQVNPGGNIVPMPWQAQFIALGNNRVKFDIRNYPANMPLFIQVDRGHTISTPLTTNLEWSTYWGASGTSSSFDDIVSDNNGNIYVSAYANAPIFPISPTLTIQNLSGYYDILFLNINPICVAQFATYIGGSLDDRATSIAIDDSNNIYIAGYTISIDFPIVIEGTSYVDSINDSSLTYYDMFYLKLNNNGQLLHSTLFGDSSLEQALDITIDNQNNLYLIGRGDTTTPRVIQTGADNFTYGKCFIVKFDNSRNIVWATPFTGVTTEIQSESIRHAVTDASNNLYIIGDFALFSKQSYFYVVKFNSQNQIQWIKYFLGGPSGSVIGSYAGDITVDADNNIFITGATTKDSNYIQFVKPNVLAYFNNNKICNGYPCDPDGYIAKLDPNGNILWGTLFGGWHGDQGVSIRVDDNGYVYLYGRTFSGINPNYSFSNTIPFPQSDPPGAFVLHEKSLDGSSPNNLLEEDPFFSIFSPSLRLIYTSLWGGAGIDNPKSITVSNNNYLYIIGNTASNTGYTNPALRVLIPTQEFDVTPGSEDYFQPIDDDLPFDAYIARFNLFPILSLNIQENYFDNFSVFLYPNPSKGENIMITFNQYINNPKVIVHDVLGKIIFTESYKNSINHLFLDDLTYLSQGIFILKIESENQNYVTRFSIIK